jgi:hypothetical protein
VGLDLGALRSALRDHLLGRLIDLKDGLDYLQENFTGSDVMPGDAIRVMQLEDGDIDAIFSTGILRSRPCPITMNDIDTWIDRANIDM